MQFCCHLQANAQRRSESEAIQIAQDFLSKKGRSPKLSVVPGQEVETRMAHGFSAARRSPAKDQGFYVVNDEANNRFVIVSADERMYEILGYSDNGTFAGHDVPCGFQALLASYNTLYDSLLVSDAGMSGLKARKSGFKRIGPLIKSKWGQSTPYNDQCPYDVSKSETKRCLTGCVATAMAQVMNYYQYPDRCRGAYSYDTPFGLNLELDFDAVTLDWSKMQDIYSFYVNEAGRFIDDDRQTEEEKAAVAKLMYACGVSVSMDYGVGLSTSKSENIAYALINYFRYNPNVVFKEKQYYSDDEWDEMILRELEAGHPVLYSGASNLSDSHQFILDGCDEEGRYSFNFGWSGLTDGFYYLTGANSINYDWIQNMVCQVTPEEWGVQEDVFYASRFTCDKTKTAIGESARFYFSPICVSSATTYQEPDTGTFDGEIGIGLYDTDFNFIKALCKKDVSGLTIGSSESVQANIVFDANTFQNGTTYMIAPYAKGKEYSNPTRIRTLRGEQDYYQAVVEYNTVKLWVKGIEFNDVLTGTYIASAINKDGNMETWEVVLNKSGYSGMSYIMSNFDPALNRLQDYDGYINNYVVCDVNADGTKLSIYSRSSLGKNIRLNNVSGEGSIIVHLDAQKNTMFIDDVWGVNVTTVIDDDDAQVDEISRYTNTKYVYADNSTSEAKVEPPLIEISSQGVVTLVSRTPESIVYYTLDGTSPTADSQQYNAPFQLTENCTVKAIAVKGGKESEVAEREVTSFVVEKPVIYSEDGLVKMTCATPGSTICYTTDESIPSAASEKYMGEISCSVTTVFRAVAIKRNFADSPVETYVFVPNPEHDSIPSPTTDNSNMVIEYNVAGQLESHFTEQTKLSVISLTVSGDLNGTDFKFIGELCRKGRLASLDLKNSRIVEGGDAYYSVGLTDYHTKNDIVGGFMFSDAEALVNLQLPASAKRMDMGAVLTCGNLKELAIPERCDAVKTNAISDCKSLAAVTLSAAVKDFAPGNFSGCPNLQHIGVAPGSTTYKSVDGVLYSYDVTTIVRFPTGVVADTFAIPATVHTIGDNAFRESSIRNFVLPSSLKRIGTMAFGFCKQLENIVIPDSVENLGTYTFTNCSNLLSVALPSEIAEIGMKTFEKCVNLTELIVGANVSKIEGDALDGCQSLQRFVVDAGNPWYCSVDGILYTKDMRKVVRCPEARYAIELVIPDGVETIGEHAFYCCKNIGVFHLPGTAKTIEGFSFSNCMMKSISLSKQVEYIGDAAFMSCKNMEMLVIPDGVKEIRMSLLNNCYNLAYVYIPESVRVIESSAFTGCISLAMINSRVKDIESVKIENLSSFSRTPFQHVSDTCTWRVPVGCAEKYKALPWWVSTWKVIEWTPDGSDIAFVSIPDNNPEIDWKDGILLVKSEQDAIIHISAFDGILKRRVKVKKGQTCQVELPQGMYIINNRKIWLK